MGRSRRFGRTGCPLASDWRIWRFAPTKAWVHFDIFAWNNKARPGFPVGGEVQAIRALYAMLKARYA